MTRPVYLFMASAGLIFNAEYVIRGQTIWLNMTHVAHNNRMSRHKYHRMQELKKS